eukprot:768536-Hanusia_phi.AAC.18
MHTISDLHHPSERRNLFINDKHVLDREDSVPYDPVCRHFAAIPATPRLLARPLPHITPGFICLISGTLTSSYLHIPSRSSQLPILHLLFSLVFFSLTFAVELALPPMPSPFALAAVPGVARATSASGGPTSPFIPRQTHPPHARSPLIPLPVKKTTSITLLY